MNEDVIDEIHRAAVEDIRGWAQRTANEARWKYYHAAMRFWMVAPGGERMLARIREAAALDGVQLEDE